MPIAGVNGNIRGVLLELQRIGKVWSIARTGEEVVALQSISLDVTPGENILLADATDAAAWVRELAGLAESESWRRQLTESARQLVRERYDWAMLGELLWKAYREWLESAA